MERYGSEIETDLTLEHFVELYDSLADTRPDEDWRDVAILDSDDWCVTFSPDYIAFENVEEDDEEGEIKPSTRALALDIADAYHPR